MVLNELVVRSRKLILHSEEFESLSSIVRVIRIKYHDWVTKKVTKRQVIKKSCVFAKLLIDFWRLCGRSQN